jgi:glycosyltransferase involved in cell wall biosynthesis
MSRPGEARAEGGSAPPNSKPAGGRTPTVWFEIEDILRHFDHIPNPTGISRFCLELFTELEAHFGTSGRVRFCRLSLYRRRFEAVDFDRLTAAYLDPPGADAPWHAFAWLGRPRDEIPKLLRTLRRLPRYVRRIAGPLLRDMLVGGAPWQRFEESIGPGDVIVNLGASWINSRYAERVVELKRRHGVKFVQMLHDIGLMAVEAWAKKADTGFLRWLDAVLPASDLILTVSSFSRRDIERFATRTGRSWPPVRALRLGNGFRHRRSAPTKRQAPRAWPERFIMFVSTIEERRKNHPFLIGVWQRLVERHGADAVPQLLLVGHPGYRIVDFLDFRAKLLACNFVDGKISIVSDMSDTELEEAYRRCLFTLYPSLYEGWGSPVAESLGYGKFCVASNRTSLPEVGGDFCDYFDPTDEAEAVAKIERALFDPGYLAGREAHIRAAYRPPTWADCAHQLMAELEPLTQVATPHAGDLEPAGGFEAARSAP